MDDNFIWAAYQTHLNIGNVPLIGTFKPNLGDLGRDPDNNLWAWDGSRWINSKGQPAKTFSKWMGFDG